MVDILMTAAQDPLTPRFILAGLAIIFVVESWKTSGSALLGDMFSEGLDD